MLKCYQPNSLLTLTLKSLAYTVASSCDKITCSIDDPLFCVVRKYCCSIPSNTFDLWVKELINVMKLHSFKSEFIYIIFGRSLIDLNIYEIHQNSSFDAINIPRLVGLFSSSPNVKVLKSTHAPFFFKEVELSILDRGIVNNFKCLQQLILRNLRLETKSQFLSTISTHCPTLKLLDLSYSSIPVIQYKAIAKLHNLEILILRTKFFPNITTEVSVRFLTSLSKLKWFEDDWESNYSTIPCALEEIQSSYGKCDVLIEHLNIYNKLELNLNVTSVKSIHLNSKIFRQGFNGNLDDLLYSRFPSLSSIFISIENAQFDDLLKLKKNQIFPTMIKTVTIHDLSFPLTCEHINCLGLLCPNLTKIEIVNPKPVATAHHCHHMNIINQQDSNGFSKLLHFSYNGM